MLDTNDTDDYVKVQGEPINNLLYADDTVLFAKSEKGLQKLLDKLAEYCQNFGITVNVQKTKIVIFRKGVRIREHNFMYSNNEIEIVNSFVYHVWNVLLNMCCFYFLFNCFKYKSMHYSDV